MSNVRIEPCAAGREGASVFGCRHPVNTTLLTLPHQHRASDLRHYAIIYELPCVHAKAEWYV